MDSTIELRLGNLVKVEGKTYQVASLDSCFVGLSEVGKDTLLFDVDVKDVEPIQLNEELILKAAPLGVITTDDKYVSGGLYFFYKNEKEKGYNLCKSFSMFEGKVVYTEKTGVFSTVHEFQNAYRDLLKQGVDVKNLI